MKDGSEPLSEPGRRAGDDGDAPVESEGGKRIESHGAASYGASTGRGLRRFLRRGRRDVSGTLPSSADPLLLWDVESLALLDVNDAAARSLGWSRDDLLLMTIAELQLDRSPRELRRDEYGGTLRHRRRDGSTAWLSVTTSTSIEHGPAARLSSARDVTALHESQARTNAIVDTAVDAILTIDLDGRIESVNPAAARLFGRAASALVGTDVGTILESTDGRPLAGPAFAHGREVIGRAANGTRLPLELSVAAVALGDRTVSTVVARDLRDRRALETRLSTQTTHDPLTGLANRSHLIELIDRALVTSRDRPVAVLCIDLDRFKVVNDSLGHTAGDALLFAVAGRLRDRIGSTGSLGRFGGDVFVVLLHDVRDPADAMARADVLSRALDEPVTIGERPVHVTASIGVTVAHERDTGAGLVRDAEVAMHRAKAQGRARIELFAADLHAKAVERMAIESDLRAGLAEHQFVVHYQPEVELATDRIVGLEALVRWDRTGDPRAPDAFLPIAEETGLIVQLGESVLAQACAEASRWHARLGGAAPTVWVNISARQLSSHALVDTVHRALATLPTVRALGLEVTETDIIPDDDVSRRVMDALVELGVKLAIDDFGTGFASLSYLWRFPAQVVKIDQSFVRRMTEDDDARVLVRAMIDMAHSLGKTIVAEGVELPEQLDQLPLLGADTPQGFLLARPQPASSIDALLTV
jgi:diguanylate cyclase (GGDEF)-like protein/PAS domain S-box-containing protein